MTVQLHLGDCLEVMRSLNENSVDTCITDPPYELGFMGKRWDSSGVAFRVATWEAVYRVLKPGALLLAFGGTRTYHRMVCAIEDAGFEIRDTIAYVYGSGFPKSLNISKAMEKQYGRTEKVSEHDLRLVREANISQTVNDEAEQREILQSGLQKQGASFDERKQFSAPEIRSGQSGMERGSDLFQETRELQANQICEMSERVSDNGAKRRICDGASLADSGENRQTINAGGGSTSHQSRPTGQSAGKSDAIPKQPSTQDIRRWEGYGTALKPAMELIVVAMKPVDGNFVNNALTWGVAGLWIDGGRVATDDSYSYPNGAGGNSFSVGELPDGKRTEPVASNTLGRFPANLIHDGSDEVLEVFPECKQANDVSEFKQLEPMRFSAGGEGVKPQKQTNGKIITASASRFFYCAKASRSERNAGLEGMEERESTEMTGRKDGSAGLLRVRDDGSIGENPYAGKSANAQNHHPTVKPISLMRYLVRLTKTPTGGVVLDPFTGSGSTGCACVLEGRDFIGIEREQDYIEIADKRIEYWARQPKLELT